jgi:excinuclease UvrABC nuclease subunit
MPRRRPAKLARPLLRSDDLTHAAYAPAPTARRRTLLAQVRASCEDRPGIYRMLGTTGLVLYVGKAKRLRTRLLSYFRAATRNRRRDRQAHILRHAHAIEWEHAPSEFAALLLELREIKRHRPRFNVAMNVDEAPRGWLALTGGEVPALRIVHRSDDPEAELLYGPFRRIVNLAEASRALGDATGVRDCSAREFAARGGCLRAELGTCACPGRAAGDARTADVVDLDAPDYPTRVAIVRDFLAGRTRAPIDVLRARMAAAAEAWQFERAAALREKLAALGWLAGRLERFHAGADRLTFRYRVTATDGSARIYLIRRGTVRAEVPAPATPDEEAALAALAARVFAGPDPAGADIPTHDLDEFYLVASWFRRHPDELAHVERGA